MHSELEAMNIIWNTIAIMESEQRWRILQWVMEKNRYETLREQKEEDEKRKLALKGENEVIE